MREIEHSDTCSIYRLRNTVNGKSYVGQTWYSIYRRWNLHRHEAQGKSHCIKLVNALRKYGANAFEPELLTVAHTQEMADYWEAYFMKRFDSIQNGYNLREAGANGRLSVETKAKMSARHKGKIIRPETRAKLRAFNLGKKKGPRSAETIAKIAASNLGKKRSDETRAKLSAAHKGKKLSDYHRQRQSEGKKGLLPTPAVLAARKALIGQKRTDESRANMRAAWVRRKGPPLTLEEIAIRDEERRLKKRIAWSIRKKRMEQS
jgi:group I intron endonuclease